MSGLYVSDHAAQRYCERVNPSLDLQQAKGEIMKSAKVLKTAADFGCSAVKLSCGARLILQDRVVVTVYPSDERFVPQTAASRIEARQRQDAKRLDPKDESLTRVAGDAQPPVPSGDH